MKTNDKRDSKSQNISSRLHEVRSENAKKEKRDSRGRFTASDKPKMSSAPKSKTPKNQNDDQIIGFIIEEEYDCGC